MRISKHIFEFQVNEKTLLFDGETLTIYKKPTNNTSGLIASPPSFEPEHLIQRGPVLRTLSLTLNNECNMACKYCYANQGDYDKPGEKMSFETAKKAIKLLYKSVTKNTQHENVITIAFFGGEPTLEFSLIQKITEYISKTLPPQLYIRYLLSTNGTNLKEKEIVFLAKNNFVVTLSIDGDKSVHDANRVYRNGKGTYDDIIYILPVLLKKLPVRARITITDKNPFIDKNVAHLIGLGFEAIDFAPMSSLSDKSYEIYTKSMQKMISQFGSSIQNKECYNVGNISNIMTSILLKRKKQTHCNAGLSYLTVSADGQLYRCPRFIGASGYSLGNVNELELKTIEELAESFRSKFISSIVEKISDCEQCPFLYLCGGMCYHDSFSKTGNEQSIDKRECNFRKILIGETLKLLCSISIDERKYIFDYLSSLWHREAGLLKVNEFDFGLTKQEKQSIDKCSKLTLCEGGSEGASG